MTISNYFMINIKTNIVNNTCVWDGDTQTWEPPPNTLMLLVSQTPAMIWVQNQDKTDWVLEETMGTGDIGFTWNGTVLTTNQPKPNPPSPQPVTDGMQTL